MTLFGWIERYLSLHAQRCEQHVYLRHQDARDASDAMLLLDADYAGERLVPGPELVAIPLRNSPELHGVSAYLDHCLAVQHRGDAIFILGGRRYKLAPALWREVQRVLTAHQRYLAHGPSAAHRLH